ncbi:MAG TPA: Type 1 glutamine amidotransferase-like domain-containing protein [Candidatus Dojkabacteria bacterium]|nr:Type 1 glutamine amidotransferase-like domain-containing protein [Candidatus Dojkabacteria bacterium]
MHTKYLLHGGNTSIKKESNSRFFKEMMDIPAKNNARLLLCLWAVEKKFWDVKKESYKKKITENSDKNVEVEVVEDVDDFNAKIDQFDVLYVVGGDAKLIEPYYQKFTDLEKQLEGKTYAGGSMGAFMVCSHYILSFDYQDELSVHDGLGLIDINLLCHWDIERKRELKIDMLKEKSPSKPILTLDEGEFVRIVR